LVSIGVGAENLVLERDAADAGVRERAYEKQRVEELHPAARKQSQVELAVLRQTMLAAGE
jgi:hypothetical protein